MASQWTCQGCGAVWPRTKQKCTCGRKRRVRTRPAHQMVLETPYELWVLEFGEHCGICGRPPGPNRRLDRDHDHKSGKARGLLCHLCNRGLKGWMTNEWLAKAAAYLTKAEERDHDGIGPAE